VVRVPPAANPCPFPLAVLRAFDGRRQHGPAAAAWFVGQPRYPVLQKPPRPLVDDAMGDPNSVGNLDHGHATTQQEHDLTPSDTARRDGRRPLPRQQRLAFVRREADREGGFPATWDRTPSMLGYPVSAMNSFSLSDTPPAEPRLRWQMARHEMGASSRSLDSPADDTP